MSRLGCWLPQGPEEVSWLPGQKRKQTGVGERTGGDGRQRECADGSLGTSFTEGTAAYSLSTYYVPGTHLGSGHKMVTQTSSCPHGGYVPNRGWSQMGVSNRDLFIYLFQEVHKEGEHPRIDVLELWCWRRLLNVPWRARRSNQSILKEIKTEYSLEGLILKLKLQNFGHLMQRADSLEKTLMLGKTEGRRRG